MTNDGYDSTADTLRHSLRVGALVGVAIKELVDRSVTHDLSKTQPPELEIFNEFTPKLREMTYGSEKYWACLRAMGPALAHHYAKNPHHPEHTERGIGGMTLVDLIEMLADWKAAGERHSDGDLGRSLAVQRERFKISDQLMDVLVNTAYHFGWLPHPEVPEYTPSHDILRRHLYATHCNGAALALSDQEAARQHREFHDEELTDHDQQDLTWSAEAEAQMDRDMAEMDGPTGQS